MDEFYKYNVEQKNPDKKYASCHIKFKNRQNSSAGVQVWITVIPGDWERSQREVYPFCT